MHSKRKGNIGQLVAAMFLSKCGYSVFSEIGDISKIDLIAENNGNLIRFQCKAVTPKKGVIEVPLRKCGLNYVYIYNPELFDFFSIYDLVNDNLYFIPSVILTKYKNSFTLRLEEHKCSKNNASDYLAVKIIKQVEDKTADMSA